MTFFKTRISLPLVAISIGSIMILYGVFIQPLFLHNDYVEDYNSGVRHLRTYLESGDKGELGSAEKSFRHALSGSPSPPVAAATFYNGTLPTLTGTDWKNPESRSILEGVIAELEAAGRYDPTDKDIKINLTKAIALKELADKFFRKTTGDAIVPLPPNLQSSREEAKEDENKLEPKDLPGQEPGSKTPPPDF